MINNIQYADDTVLLASSETRFQILPNAAHCSGSSEKLDLSLNINKTEVMVVSKKLPEPSMSITALNNVESWLTMNGKCEKEIR